MRLEYIPFREFSERVSMGWRLASELKPGDYAAVMEAPRESMNNKTAGRLCHVKYAGYDATESA